MRIAIRNGKDSEWKRIPTQVEQVDGSVQDLIRKIPELISVEALEPDGSSLKVCVKNGSEGDSGLIGVDDKGKITIVECKLPNDSSVRREIVGQALEYAAMLWEMSYEEFDKMVVDSEGRTLVDLMSERVPAEKWSEEEFKQAVASALQQGKFRLVMAIQSMTDELRRTIKFLSARGPFSFETYAAQMQYFSDGETEIIVPNIMSFAEVEEEDSGPKTISQTYRHTEPNVAKSEEPSSIGSKASRSGRTGKPSGSSEPTIAQSIQSKKEEDSDDKQKEDLFFAKCQETVSENAVGLVRRLYEFSKEAADDIIWWGSSGAGAFNFVLTDDGLTVFIVDANGKIMFNFSEWQRDNSYKDLLPQFLEKLKAVSVLNKQKEDYTRWPDFSVEEFFANPDDFQRFEEAIRFLKEELKNVALV